MEKGLLVSPHNALFNSYLASQHSPSSSLLVHLLPLLAVGPAPYGEAVYTHLAHAEHAHPSETMRAASLSGIRVLVALACLAPLPSAKRIKGRVRTVNSVQFLTKFVFIPNKGDMGNPDGEFGRLEYTFIFDAAAQIRMPVFFYGSTYSGYDKALKADGCMAYVDFARTKGNNNVGMND